MEGWGAVGGHIREWVAGESVIIPRSCRLPGCPYPPFSASRCSWPESFTGYGFGARPYDADHHRGRSGYRRRYPLDGCSAAARERPAAEQAALDAVRSHRFRQHDADAGRDQRGHERAGAAVASVLLNTAPFFVRSRCIVLAERLSRLRLAGLVVGFAVCSRVLSDRAMSRTGGPGHRPRARAVGPGLGARDSACVGYRFESLSSTCGMTARSSLRRRTAPGLLRLRAARRIGMTRRCGRRWRSRDRRAGAGLPGLQRGARAMASTKVYAWTFLVPAVAVVIEAVRGTLPTALGVAGIVLVIVGVAIVNHPRAELAPSRPGRRPRRCGHRAVDGQQEAQRAGAEHEDRGRPQARLEPLPLVEQRRRGRCPRAGRRRWPCSRSRRSSRPCRRRRRRGSGRSAPRS